MGAPRGSRNAGLYQAEIVEGTLVRIEGALSKVLSERLMFNDVTSLTDYVAPLVGRSAHRLRRNPAYRIVFETYLAAHCFGSKPDSDRDAIIHLECEVRELKLRVSNVTADKQRLVRYIEKYGGDPDALNNSMRLQSPSRERSKSEQLEEAARQTFALLDQVLERVEVIVADRESGVLIDRSARPGRQQVGTPAQARYYIDWRWPPVIDG